VRRQAVSRATPLLSRCATIPAPLDGTPGSCTLFVEGEEPQPAISRGQAQRRTFAATLPPYAAAVVTMKRDH